MEEKPKVQQTRSEANSIMQINERVINGNLLIPKGTIIEAPLLETVEGEIFIEDNATLNVPVLQSVGGYVDLGANATLVAPVLQSVGGYVDLGANATLDTPVLQSVGGRVYLMENVTLNAPVLQSVGGDVVVDENATLDAPVLQSVGGRVCLMKNVTLNALVLQSVGGDVVVDENATLDAPVLQSVGGNVFVDENATLNAPALESIESALLNAVSDTSDCIAQVADFEKQIELTGRCESPIVLDGIYGCVQKVGNDLKFEDSDSIKQAIKVNNLLDQGDDEVRGHTPMFAVDGDNGKAVYETQDDSERILDILSTGGGIWAKGEDGSRAYLVYSFEKQGLVVAKPYEEARREAALKAVAENKKKLSESVDQKQTKIARGKAIELPNPVQVRGNELYTDGYGMTYYTEREYHSFVLPIEPFSPQVDYIENEAFKEKVSKAGKNEKDIVLIGEKYVVGDGDMGDFMDDDNFQKCFSVCTPNFLLDKILKKQPKAFVQNVMKTLGISDSVNVSRPLQTKGKSKGGR